MTLRPETLPELDTEAVAERYPAVIRRIAKDKRITTAKARARFVEMLKFLDCCALRDRNLSPPPRVDDAWHAFILFTRDYAAYCEKRFGFFVHHTPTDSGSPSAYEAAYAEASERFGPLDRKIWPRPRAARSASPSATGGSGGWFGGFFGSCAGGGSCGGGSGCGGSGCGGGGCGGGS